MIQVGNKVVCINDEFEPWVHALYAALPQKNEIYTVRDIQLGVNVKTVESNPDSSICFRGNQTITLLLEELINPDMPISKKEMGFGAWRFAPIETIEDENVVEKEAYIPKIMEFTAPKRELEEIAA